MNKTKITILAFALALLFGAVSTIEAQSRYSNTELGVILGEPTGISFKSWQSDNTAIDAALAWSFGESGSVHLHADYLRHKWLDVETGSLAFYYGLGARAVFADDSKFGARIPVGLQYLFPDTRLSMFFEVAPTLNLIPDTDFGVNGGIGVRFFL
ncbi:hypothetical protein [Rhodohalobacter halophilus]|uniref:hypothetical protein n=1 Tax=Rhodohalobacter halophilus TaxID=1812810 RepID=UPI00083FCB67|nr:hypothetical protein [Rhodohalobacter halophilus]